MKQTHDYNAATGAGSSKLVVFIDSLSRWVEAIPVHSDPTSSQILDLFMEHVVSRHGVPRRIVTDHGSNLSSRLCNAIMENTGVDPSPAAAPVSRYLTRPEVSPQLGDVVFQTHADQPPYPP